VAKYEDSEPEDDICSHDCQSVYSVCMSLADSGPCTDEGTHGSAFSVLDSDIDDLDDSQILVFQTTPKNNLCANRADFAKLPDYEKETELDEFMNANLL
jgi:hypothetical protein